MKIDIIRIGNSRGIRLPKAVIDQCQFTEQVELEVRGGEVILRTAKRSPREGWEEAFHAAGPVSTSADEAADFEVLKNAFDETEWTWDEDEVKATRTFKHKRS